MRVTSKIVEPAGKGCDIAVSERDQALIRAAQQGNKEAFATLVEHHKGRVYRTLYQVVGDDQEAQDLSQEVFLKVYRSLPGYRGDAVFTTWLHRVTLNLAFDWLRARKRKPLHVPLHPPADQEDRPAMEIRSDEAGPEESALRTERKRELQAAIQGLSQEYREVILLYHFHHMSYQQIAERLQVPVRTVETRLYRAKGLLKKQLAEGGERSGVQQGAGTAAGISGAGVKP